MQTVSSGIRWLFESLDQARKRRGDVMDQLGYGPSESPWRTAFSSPGVRLRFYGGNPASNSIALIVPAPIKRHYIWDLSPECSVVQHAMREDMQVYLAEWTEPLEERYGHACGPGRQCLPGEGARDGFFYARLRKRA